MKRKYLMIAGLLAVAASVPFAIGTDEANAATTCQSACYATFVEAQAVCKATYHNVYYGQCMTTAGNTYGRCLSACS